MSSAPSTNKVYLVTVTILPQKDGLNVPQLILQISNEIKDYSSSVTFIHKFKVSGEPTVVLFIEASDIFGLERFLASLWKLGPLDVDTQPIIPYERFAESLKLAGELCKPSGCALQREGVYWLEVKIEYHGHSYDEFLAIWKKEAETVLTLRGKGEANIELFKTLAQRKVHLLLTSSDPAQLDQLALQLPIIKENGDNIDIKSKGLQFLEDYVARFHDYKK